MHTRLRTHHTPVPPVRTNGPAPLAPAGPRGQLPGEGAFCLRGPQLGKALQVSPDLRCVQCGDSSPEPLTAGRSRPTRSSGTVPDRSTTHSGPRQAVGCRAPHSGPSPRRRLLAVSPASRPNTRAGAPRQPGSHDPPRRLPRPPSSPSSQLACGPPPAARGPPLPGSAGGRAQQRGATAALLPRPHAHSFTQRCQSAAGEPAPGSQPGAGNHTLRGPPSAHTHKLAIPGKHPPVWVLGEHARAREQTYHMHTHIHTHMHTCACTHATVALQ